LGSTLAYLPPRSRAVFNAIESGAYATMITCKPRFYFSIYGQIMGFEKLLTK
jgi:hypothetical protein